VEPLLEGLEPVVEPELDVPVEPEVPELLEVPDVLPALSLPGMELLGLEELGLLLDDAPPEP
jgi:hypothetical protein